MRIRYTLREYNIEILGNIQSHERIKFRFLKKYSNNKWSTSNAIKLKRPLINLPRSGNGNQENILRRNLNEKELRWQEENFDDVVNKLRILRFNLNLRSGEWENLKVQTDDESTFKMCASSEQNLRFFKVL